MKRKLFVSEDGIFYVRIVRRVVKQNTENDTNACRDNDNKDTNSFFFVTVGPEKGEGNIK